MKLEIRSLLSTSLRKTDSTLNLINFWSLEVGRFIAQRGGESVS